ncbi:MAG: chemotaxis protein CheB [Methanomicrobiaceae archaeon]|nr:chemotaxis protein CheB [Methanomicrobiaceae archaeon]
MIRVLVIDDSLFVRTLLRDMLEADPEIEVAGTAVNGIDGLKKIGELSPDVVTLDIEMPRMSGLEVLAALREADRRPKVLVLSTLTSGHAAMTHRALRLGADDFMLKPRDIQQMRGLEREIVEKVKNQIRIAPPAGLRKAACGSADMVVLIGSSAGGPHMLDQVISSLDPELKAVVIVTQHMPEGFTAVLAERLNRISALPAKETENGEAIRDGTVLISKAGYHSIVSGMIGVGGKVQGKIVHSHAPPVHAVRPAVDKTFISAARVFGPRTVSVLLSGMGRDGGEGTAAVKAAGGATMVCAEEDCLVYGMARSALSRDCVDQIVPLHRISREIERIVAEKGG